MLKIVFHTEKIKKSNAVWIFGSKRHLESRVLTVTFQVINANLYV